jgi:hypothetical protein
MRKAILIAIIATFSSACGPQVDDEERPPGELELEYEDSRGRLYRLERRVEVIYDYEREDGLRGKCGFLTDRAYDDLESTLAALDPGVDYGDHPADCSPDEALVHVDGFEHSPFECSLECCRSGLTWAALVYHMILVNLDGTIPAIIIGNERDPYVAIEPDQPCP